MSGLRRVGRVLMALWRFAKRYVPKWLVPVLAVCLLVPGPLDEFARARRCPGARAQVTAGQARAGRVG